MKKIFIVVSSLKTGGAEMQAVWLANKFAETTHDVSLVVLKRGLEIDSLVSDQVEIIEFKMYVYDNLKSLRLLRIFYNFFMGVYNLRSIIKNNDEEVVVFSFLFHSNILSFLSTIKLQCKHYICIRSDRFSSRKGSRNLKYRSFLVYLISFFSNGLVFNSKKSLKNLGDKFPSRIKKYFIPNAVIRSQTEELDEILNKILNFLDNNEITMLSVGRLEDLKNYENIILAIKDLLNKGIYIKYIIFGKGYLDQKLRSLVQSHNLENNILLIGMVPNVYNYYKYFKYFIIASIHEGYPNSLIEAMDNELTAFGTDCGDTFEIIDNNRGIKIDGFESKDIKNTLMNYFSNKKLQSAVSLNANKYVKFELSDEVIFSKWLNLL